jgi:amino acid transporter
MGRLARLLIGKPKDVKASGILHQLALIPLLAWVGLGADGLSSSAYGPEEAFRALGEYKGLAVFLALSTAATIFVIAYGYNRIIEQFPSGGGGYVVTSKVLGPRFGVISGSALLVDYVLTIAISMASGADAVLSFVPAEFHGYKVLFAGLGIFSLGLLNIRGIRESVLAISPIFFAFIVTHVVVLGAVIAGHASDIGRVASEVDANVRSSFTVLGVAGALHLLVRAYSLGGGSFTGIEAVCNGVPIMREPRVETAKRTMMLMATSLAVMASGIIVAYLLMDVSPVAGKTMNAVLIDRVAGGWTLEGMSVGKAFVVVALLSEAGLLLIAAQAGLVAGPRVMANMATDSWWPHRFAALSDRLTMRNGVVVMSLCAMAAVFYTGGKVSQLVVMYSINVFIDFSLSNGAMVVYWAQHRHREIHWWKHTMMHLLATLLCMTILVMTVLEKFGEGAWLTVVITFGVVVLCFEIRRHYRLVSRAVERLDKALPGPERPAGREHYEDLLVNEPVRGAIDPEKPVAIVFVGRYSALGRRTVTSLLRLFPGHFHGVVFVSIAIVDSDTFKGVFEIQSLEARTRGELERYQKFAAALGLTSESATATGAEIALEAEKVVKDLAARFPNNIVVAGQLIFEEDTVWTRLLHNETAFLIQRQLQHIGIPMIVLPDRLDLKPAPASANA